MKKLLFVVLVFSAFVTSANAGLYSSLTGLTMKSQPTDKEWALDVVGQDVRVYEFTTKTEPKMKCVTFFPESSSKSPVMQCTPIKGK